MSQAADQVFSEFIFLAVPTSSLIHRKTAVTDLFVRLPSDRMVKVANRGGAIDGERIQRFGDKHVQYLYVYRTDFSNIVNDLVRGAEGLNQLSQVPADLKIAKFFNIAESVYAELLRLPITDESLGRAIRLSGEISTAMREKPDFEKLIKSVVSMGDEFTRHSLGCVVMSNLLVAELEWSSPKLLAPVTMGAFFHDIGLKEISPSLWFKPKVQMTQDEVAVWETHPAMGVKLLSQIHMITPETLRIVQEHHEIPNGTGFPARLRLDRIFPMAKVVSLANMLAHEMFDKGNTERFSMDAMGEKIDHVYSTMYGADISRAARKIFKKDET
jgi:HD-GYP domain-containing protein (c-di-GMP phosphodiesterase class II)